MKKTFLLITILFYISIINISFSCTTFVLKTDNDLVFGRNLDWVSDNGLLIINKRNQVKISLVFPPNEAVKWTSRYGSVTFNQFGKEFPFGGINEKGLVIEIMNAKAEYPEIDDRKALNELQWIQYHLDRSSSIDEIIQSDKVFRISMVSQELHFLISDNEGKVAVIEFVNGVMKVYKDKTLKYPVLENSTYEKSLKNYKENKYCRFGTAVDMINEYNSNTNVVDYSFEILDEVALDGSWSIVYDIKNMQVHFKTSSQINIKTVDFDTLEFDCNSSDFMYDLKLNDKGKINSLFVKFESKINEAKMIDAMDLTQISLPSEIKQTFYEFHKSVFCREE